MDLVINERIIWTILVCLYLKIQKLKCNRKSKTLSLFKEHTQAIRTEAEGNHVTHFITDTENREFIRSETVKKTLE